MVNNGSPAKDTDKYADTITEMYFELPIDTMDLPVDDKLFDEAAARRYSFDKAFRRKVESKLELKKRLGRSPDHSDSLLLAYYNPHRTELSDDAAAFFRG
jgi:hypothetical protein